MLREYNDLELYLMGLVNPAQVGPHFVFNNQNQAVAPGAILQGPVTNITTSDIIAVNGPRVPAAADSPSNFAIATIVLSKNRLLTVQEMAFFDSMAARGEATVQLPFSSGFSSGLTKPFFVATGTRGTLAAEIPDGCPGDVAPANPDGSYGNGQVEILDFLSLLLAWGSCASPCPHDIDRDGTVGIGDMLLLLANWGPCA